MDECKLLSKHFGLKRFWSLLLCNIASMLLSYNLEVSVGPGHYMRTGGELGAKTTGGRGSKADKQQSCRQLLKLFEIVTDPPQYCCSFEIIAFTILHCFRCVDSLRRTDSLEMRVLRFPDWVHHWRLDGEGVRNWLLHSDTDSTRSRTWDVKAEDCSPILIDDLYLGQYVSGQRYFHV